MSTGRDFGSDNRSGVAPEVLRALERANKGTASAYGDDPWTADLERRLSDLFEKQVRVFPVFTGTAANALALAQISPPYGAIFCSEQSHIFVDECGAPELQTGGARLVPVAAPDGKMTASALAGAVARFPKGVMHHHQPAALTLTQGTECGRIYRAEDLRELTNSARELGLKTHMDGARFANAVAASGAAPADLTWRAGIDILSFGLTKNGAIAAEAVVIFDAALAEAFIYRQKRAGQVSSKMRFVSAQFLGLLDENAWLRHAANANARARRLAEAAAQLGLPPRWRVEINEVFLDLAPAAADRLRAEGFTFFPWDPPAADGRRTYRFVTSFTTTEQDVDALIQALSAGRD